MSANITSITVRVGDSGPMILKGRAAWALHNLDHPGPRWSHYAWLIRRAGINVETITEAHGGPYSGTHARYVLLSPVEVVALQEAGS
jgi:hypothetical protein